MDVGSAGRGRGTSTGSRPSGFPAPLSRARASVGRRRNARRPLARPPSGGACDDATDRAAGGRWRPSPAPVRQASQAVKAPAEPHAPPSTGPLDAYRVAHPGRRPGHVRRAPGRRRRPRQRVGRGVVGTVGAQGAYGFLNRRPCPASACNHWLASSALCHGRGVWSNAGPVGDAGWVGRGALVLASGSARNPAEKNPEEGEYLFTYAPIHPRNPRRPFESENPEATGSEQRRQREKARPQAT